MLHKYPSRDWMARRGVASLLLLMGLFVGGVCSLANGIERGLKSGKDFQWSGARLLSDGIDPWKVFLQGDPQHRILLNQAPNYLHELYLLLLPLGMLGLDRALAVWCCLNVLFLVGSLVLVTRIYHLRPYASLTLAALLMLSAPLRASFANGQQSLITLFCFAAAFSVASYSVRGIMLGIGFAKYSFAPVVILTTLFRRRVEVLLCAALPILAGIVFAWYRTGTPFATIMVEPLRCAAVSVAPGYADIMTIIDIIFRRLPSAASYGSAVAGASGFLCAIGFAIFLARRQFSERVEFALALTFTLFCFKHLIHDYVFLLFPLAALFEWAQARTSTAQQLPTKDDRWAEMGASALMLYLLLIGGAVSNYQLLGSLPLTVINGLCLLGGSALIVRVADNRGSSVEQPQAKLLSSPPKSPPSSEPELVSS